MVKIAHEGHQEVLRTKQLLRAHVWFSGIDAMVKSRVGKCLSCQATVACNAREPLRMMEMKVDP